MNEYVCPVCKGLLSVTDNDCTCTCTVCQTRYEIRQDIPILLPPSLAVETWQEAAAWDEDGRRMETALATWETLLFKEAAVREFSDTISCVSFRGRALEIGTGSGWASALVKLKFPGMEVYASDVALASIHKAQEMAGLFGVYVDHYLAMDTAMMPFPDDTFDILFGCSVLHHIADLPRALCEIYRVLKPGGTYFGTGEEAVPKLWQWLLTKTGIRAATDIYGLPERMFTYPSWRQMFRAAGFTECRLSVSKNPRYKYDTRASYLYNLMLGAVPDAVITRLMGCSLIITAGKSR